MAQTALIADRLAEVIARLTRRLHWALDQMRRLDEARAKKGTLDPDEDALRLRCDRLIKKLKGIETRRAYLHLPVAKSNEGAWPLAPGQSAGAAFSDGQTYWKGFQRRWAVGLEMHCAAPVTASK